MLTGIDKDVFRTDRNMEFFHPNPRTIEEDLQLEKLRLLQQLLLAYYAYDPELEYVQGMADLLSPILFVLRDETETFWAFVFLMKRQRRNFEVNGTGIQQKMSMIKELIRLVDPLLSDHLGFTNDTAQLIFCYRWLLVLFKREFSFENTLVIWQTILSCEETEERAFQHYEVFIAAAIMNLAKNGIMQKCLSMGETLSFLTQLTHQIDLKQVLDRTDQIFQVMRSNKSLRRLYATSTE
jgi:TBC1 domain family member 15